MGQRVSIPSGLVRCFRSAGRVAVLTGAGISAESGVPTFRDAQTGLWARYSPEELASPTAFRRDPRLVWEWYAWRRRLVSQAAPNPGHLALAALERRVPELTLVTQNVDGLHRRAGSTRVVELHGDLTRARCSVEDAVVVEWDLEAALPPRCPRCGALLRPDVVWFGEAVPAGALAAAADAAQTCDVLLVVGTSGIVYPAAALPHLAARRGAAVAELNPEETPLSAVATWVLRAPAGLALPALLRALDG